MGQADTIEADKGCLPCFTGKQPGKIRRRKSDVDKRQIDVCRQEYEAMTEAMRACHAGMYLSLIHILEGSVPDAEERLSALVRAHVGSELPVAKTQRIGHGTDSAAVRIGCLLYTSRCV